MEYKANKRTHPVQNKSIPHRLHPLKMVIPPYLVLQMKMRWQVDDAIQEILCSDYCIPQILTSAPCQGVCNIQHMKTSFVIQSRNKI